MRCQTIHQLAPRKQRSLGGGARAPGRELQTRPEPDADDVADQIEGAEALTEDQPAG